MRLQMTNDTAGADSRPAITYSRLTIAYCGLASNGLQNCKLEDLEVIPAYENCRCVQAVAPGNTCRECNLPLPNGTMQGDAEAAAGCHTPLPYSPASSQLFSLVSPT